jgi:hypothetical protein
VKVYYISSGLQGCYNVRCLMPLQANGWDGDQTSVSLDARTPENKSKAAQDAEVVVFHRPDTPEKLELARLLKMAGKKIVFDNDDTLKDDGGFRFNEYMDKERLKKGLGKMNESIDSFIKEAHLITCSTKFLAEEYKQLNPNVVVLPNCVDPFYYDEPLRNETGVVRIGLTGSIGVTNDMLVAEPIIKHFEGRNDIRMVLFSLPPKKHDKITRELYSEEYKFLDTADIEWQPFVDHQDYYETLNGLKLDIMIIPRADNYFNRCKSNLKFMEASMFEIPVIAQGFSVGQSPYEQDPEDAEHMVIVKNNEDWIPEIEKLAKDKQRRLEMGKKAREYVLSKYNIEDNAQKWEEAYKLA